MKGKRFLLEFRTMIGALNAVNIIVMLSLKKGKVEQNTTSKARLKFHSNISICSWKMLAGNRKFGLRFDSLCRVPSSVSRSVNSIFPSSVLGIILGLHS